MTITITKARSASTGFGRGSDNTRTSASYFVKLDDKIVGFIYSDPRRAYQRAAWVVDRFDAHNIPREAHRTETRVDAFAFANDFFVHAAEVL